MEFDLKGSVGRLGENVVDDVIVVQHLLLQQGLAIGRADGQCGPRTIAGITTFQTAFLRNPDGLVAPGGKTIKRLNMVGFMPRITSWVAPTATSHHAIEKAVPSEVPVSVTRLVPRSSLGILNHGLVSVENTFMFENFGKPRDSYGTDCQPITNERLKKCIHTASVGPFVVTGLKPAVESLQVIMREIFVKQPATYSALGTVGMLCCRFMRGSITSISNHSWGCAIDLTLNGVLDKRGNGLVQYGLSLIAPIFNSYDWYWGAGFKTEDAMHFEASKKLLEQWLPILK
jgi:peptidoglycan hydrolase-like protein with peptidoglycan-binding domain